jgi:uncharacterized protein
MTGRVSTNPVARRFFLVLGFLFLGVGLVGVVLPLVPTTINLILAAYFFSRSSERWETWVLEHKRFGPLVRDFRSGLGIPLRAKVWAVALIAVTFTISIVFVIELLAVRVLLVALAVAVSAYILTRPTKRVRSTSTV